MACVQIAVVYPQPQRVRPARVAATHDGAVRRERKHGFYLLARGVVLFLVLLVLNFLEGTHFFCVSAVCGNHRGVACQQTFHSAVCIGQCRNYALVVFRLLTLAFGRCIVCQFVYAGIERLVLREVARNVARRKNKTARGNDENYAWYFIFCHVELYFCRVA